MDITQNYVLFLIKAIVHVQYFNNYGHVGKACPFYPEIRFQNNYHGSQKYENDN